MINESIKIAIVLFYSYEIYFALNIYNKKDIKECLIDILGNSRRSLVYCQTK